MRDLNEFVQDEIEELCEYIKIFSYRVGDRLHIKESERETWLSIGRKDESSSLNCTVVGFELNHSGMSTPYPTVLVLFDGDNKVQSCAMKWFNRGMCKKKREKKVGSTPPHSL